MVTEDHTSYFTFKLVSMIFLLVSLFLVIDKEAENYISFFRRPVMSTWSVVKQDSERYFFHITKQCDVYEAYADGIIIGYINDKNQVNEAFNGLKADLNINDNTKYKSSDRFTYKRAIGSNIKFASLKELKENIKRNLDMEVEAYKLIINNKELGYVAQAEQVNPIMQKVGVKYSELNNINSNDIQSIDVFANSRVIHENAKISKVLSVDEMADKILSLNEMKNKNFVDIEMTINKKEIVEISPVTIISPTTELYLGESKIIQGTPGSKEIINLFTYKNCELISKKKVEEKVLLKPKDTVIYRGIRNPVVEGMAFLSKPSRGYISSSYGSRRGGTHHGIDIAGKAGDPIGAAFDGKIIEVGYSTVYGNFIRVSHDCGIETVYGHCSKVLTKKGEWVKRGEVIGKVGSTGRSTGPHLHFELRVNGEAINPVKFIK